MAMYSGVYRVYEIDDGGEHWWWIAETEEGAKESFIKMEKETLCAADQTKPEHIKIKMLPADAMIKINDHGPRGEDARLTADEWCQQQKPGMLATTAG